MRAIMPLQVVLAIFSLVSLIMSPWSFDVIYTQFWIVFIQLLTASILVIVLLSIGLMPYFGQLDITREHDLQNKSSYDSLERINNDHIQQINKLEKENAELKGGK